MGDTFSEAFKGNRGDSRTLFEAAAGIFAGKGYHKATVEEIARTIGVAKGTLYYHFENKEELYLAVIREGVSLFKQKLDRVVATNAPPPEKIGMLIEGQLLFFEQEKDFVFLFLKELFAPVKGNSGGNADRVSQKSSAMWLRRASRTVPLVQWTEILPPHFSGW